MRYIYGIKIRRIWHKHNWAIYAGGRLVADLNSINNRTLFYAISAIPRDIFNLRYLVGRRCK